jgi:hypothetical protein
MKKIMLVLSLLLSFSLQVSAAINYRLAIPEDVAQLMQMYKNDFTKDDKQKLLVFPENMQKDIIEDAIKHGKLFVAYDDQTGKIVSFLKLYVVDAKEINSILAEELSLGLQSPLQQNCCYHFPESKEINFKLPIKRTELTQETKNNFLSSSEEAVLRSGTDTCLYLYHGSAYTLPSHRGGGLSTKLLVYGFNAIKSAFKDKKYYALLYGQVNSNVGNYAMVRVFADTMQHTFPQQSTNGVTLQHLACRAYKPDFDSNGEFKMYCDKEHEGLGSMVVYTSKPAPSATSTTVAEQKTTEISINTSNAHVVNATSAQQTEAKESSTSKLQKIIKTIYGFGMMESKSA